MGRKARKEKKRESSLAAKQKRAARYEKKHRDKKSVINDSDKPIIDRIMARIIPDNYYTSETEPEGVLISSEPSVGNPHSQYFDRPAQNLPTNLQILSDLSYLGLSRKTVMGIHNVIRHAVVNAVENQNRGNLVRTRASSKVAYDPEDTTAPYGIALKTDTVGYSEQFIADLKLTVETDLQKKFDQWPEEFSTDHTWAKVTENYSRKQQPA